MRRNFAAVNRLCGIRGYGGQNSGVRWYGGTVVRNSGVRWSEFGGTRYGVRWYGIRGYGGTGVRWCENTLSARARAPAQSTNPEHQPRAPTQSTSPKPRQPRVGADSRVCPPVPKPQTSHRNTGRHGGLPLQLGATTSEKYGQTRGSAPTVSRKANLGPAASKRLTPAPPHHRDRQREN